jgi:hypothetical protein
MNKKNIRDIFHENLDFPFCFRVEVILQGFSFYIHGT